MAQPKHHDQTAAMDQVILTLGTYSGGLLGYELSATTNELQPELPNIKAKLVFAYSAHVSCVKAICSVGPLLLTGSTDETVKIFQLGAKRELGSLSHVGCSVTAIALLPDSNPQPPTATSSSSAGAVASAAAPFALTGAEDGTLRLWRTKDWQLVTQLKGHTATIEAVAFHPSGRLALTVSSGSEKCLRLFDLMRGTCAISQKFDEAPIYVQWSLKGDLYCVLFQRRLLIRHASIPNLEASTLFSDISSTDEPQGSFTAVAFLSHNGLVVGDTLGRINGYLIDVQDNNDGTGTVEMRRIFRCELGHQANSVPRRVKGLCIIPNLVNPFVDNQAGAAAALWFASVDSAGGLSLWHWRESFGTLSRQGLKKRSKNTRDDGWVHLNPVATIDTQARVTAVCCNGIGCTVPMPLPTLEGRVPNSNGGQLKDKNRKKSVSLHNNERKIVTTKVQTNKNWKNQSVGNKKAKVFNKIDGSKSSSSGCPKSLGRGSAPRQIPVSQRRGNFKKTKTIKHKTKKGVGNNNNSFKNLRGGR